MGSRGMSDCISLPSFHPRFWGSPFPGLSDCGKVNRGRIGGEMMRAAVSERGLPIELLAASAQPKSARRS